MKKTVDIPILVDTPIVGMKVDAVIAASAAISSGDFPDASNTGVAAGTEMKVFKGTYYVSRNNAVISNLEVHGDIVIDAKNVTLSNIKLVADTTYHALRVMDDATGFTLKDSEIDGSGSTVNAIYGFGTFLRNNLHDVDNGINTIGRVDFRDNYIHDLNGGPDAHFDGIENNGSPHMNVVHNTIINHHDQTSAIMLNNEFGNLRDITIENNRLVGGGYTIYLDGRKGGGTVDDSSIRIINNQIGGGEWGKYAFYKDKPVVSGNVGLDESLPDPTKPILIVGGGGNDSLPRAGIVNTGNEIFYALGGNDLVHGGAGNDVIYGGNGRDRLFGDAGNDRIKGDAGADVIIGGKGHDVLWGGPGVDVFEFNNVNQSPNTKVGTDMIKDFTHADRIDLRTIDADRVQSHNQRFDFIGTQQFHDEAGELRFFRRGSDTIIHADINGDGQADFALILDHVTKISTHDFLL